MKKILSLIVVLSFVTILFSGCSGFTTSSNVQIGLQMDHFAYCSAINGDRDYTEKTDKTFAPGETFYIYFEVKGLKYKKDGDQVVYHPIVSVQIADAGGNVIIPETTVIDREIRGSHPAPYLYFPLNITMPSDAKEGKYTTIVKVKDAFGSGHITSQTQFFLKG